MACSRFGRLTHAMLMLFLVVIAAGAEFDVGEKVVAVREGESTVDGQPAAHVDRGDVFRVMRAEGDLRLVGHPNHTSAWVNVELLATPDDARAAFEKGVAADPDNAE